MQRVEFFLRQIWYNGFNKEEFLMIKILLVEDDLGLSNSVFDFLDDFADVMQVFDGEEGLYEAESGVYDLILLDLMLPEKNGFQVLKELREKGINDSSSDHDCQGKFGWQGTWIWTGSRWLSDQTFLPRRTQNADSSPSQTFR